MRPVISHPTMCGMKEEFRRPSLIKIPRKKRLKGNNYFQLVRIFQGRPRQELNGPLPRPTTYQYYLLDYGTSTYFQLPRYLHYDDNGPRRRSHPTMCGMKEEFRRPSLIKIPRKKRLKGNNYFQLVRIFQGRPRQELNGPLPRPTTYQYYLLDYGTSTYFQLPRYLHYDDNGPRRRQ